MNRLNSVTVMRRELADYFNSPIAYIFTIVFVLFTGILFMSQFFLAGMADMRIFFNFMPVVLCVFLPAASMRLWAEEKKENTFELLLTFPMSPRSLVLGKFLAGFVFFLFSLASTLAIPAMIFILGRPDPGPIAGGYIGTLFLGLFFLAAGTFVSGLFRDQIVAFIVSMLSCFLLFIVGTEFFAASLDGWVPGAGSFLRKFLGVLPHFAGFQKGVIDLRDVSYFALGAAAFLVLNGFWIEGRMRPRQKEIFACATGIVAAIFIAANWLCSSMNFGRFDMTQAKLYTISPVSKKILSSLKSPVTVKYYVSPQEKMPTGLKSLEQDMIDKLDELRIASQGKLQYKVYPMEAANIVKQGDGAKEEESFEAGLEKKGIQPFQVQSIEADEMGVRLVYSAVAIAYKEKPEEVLPRITPGDLDELEYLLISKLYRMTMEKVPKIAVMAPYKQSQVDPALAALLSQLGQPASQNYVQDDYKLIPAAIKYEGFDTTRGRLSEDEPIPADADTLVLFEPVKLTDKQRADIAGFLAKGGSVFLAVQNYSFEYAPGKRGGIELIPEPKEPEVNALLAPWGLGINDNFLLDKRQEVLNISGAMRLGPFDISMPVKLPFHIRVDAKGMNPDVSISSRLEPLLYLWGSALTVNENKLKALGLKHTVLLSSSPESWTVPAQTEPFTLKSLQPISPADRGPYPLAVLVEGQFPSAPEKEGETSESARAPGKLILIGAAVPFQESFIKAGGHLNFFLNSLDALSLSEDLIRIRAKRPVDRSIGSVSTAAKMWWRFLTILLVPLLIAFSGGLRIFARAKAKRDYLQFIQKVS